MLCAMVLEGCDPLSSPCVLRLHASLAATELERGCAGALRRTGVLISGSTYVPPGPLGLGPLLEGGCAFLKEEIENPAERAFAAFLFFSSSQFFSDINKRTASLALNGILLSQGCLPFVFDSAGEGLFADLLVRFYETGNANPFMECLEARSRELWRAQPHQ